MNILAMIVFVLAIRADLYATKRAQVNVVYTNLWGETTNKTGRVVKPLDAGYAEYVEVANTNNVWLLYVVTDQQTLGRATAAKITQWNTAIGVDARLKITKVPDGNWQAQAEKWGLQPRYDAIIPGGEKVAP